MRLIRLIFKGLFLVLFCLLPARSAAAPGDPYGRVRVYTRMVEFDYLDWTLDALLLKNAQESVNVPQYLTIERQRELVFEYFRLVQWVNTTTAQIDQLYADPDITNPAQAASALNRELRVVHDMENKLKPIAESVLQYQISMIIAEEGLGVAGQPVPPVLYHATRLPNALIVSPREIIRQDANISLEPEMTTEQITALEDEVAEQLDVSALVVPVGGVGIYPTMVMSTTNLEWLLEVIAHEWIHNYLTLRPLGVNYMTSERLRTINETTANIAGKEIGQRALERFYPELTPPAPPETDTQAAPVPTPESEDPNKFNFNREMNQTRVKVDQLLAAGKTEEAEAYMETRRRFFWENGYQIRKLNQAYFAFYGAYNDLPGGGAAGRDPVGPAVQELRKRSRSLVDFLNRISQITSFEELQRLIEG